MAPWASDEITYAADNRTKIPTALFWVFLGAVEIWAVLEVLVAVSIRRLLQRVRETRVATYSAFFVVAAGTRDQQVAVFERAAIVAWGVLNFGFFLGKGVGSAEEGGEGED